MSAPLPSPTEHLANALARGVNLIGQIRIEPSADGKGYLLFHLDDEGADPDSLTKHTNPRDAREIGLYAEDGHYRFTKGELSLKSGWLFELSSLADLRLTLDHFYPASVGLWTAFEHGTVRVQHLREKLGRQTGMYRHAAGVSDKGAQDLVKNLCGPSNQCVKKILWKIDEETPLEESEASTFPGYLPEASSTNAIPLVCQEACNFFVAQARKKSKEEFEAKAL